MLTVSQTLFSVCSLGSLIESFTQPILSMPILKMRKLRFREEKQLWHMGGLAAEGQLFSTLHAAS